MYLFRTERRYFTAHFARHARGPSSVAGWAVAVLLVAVVAGGLPVSASGLPGGRERGLVEIRRRGPGILNHPVGVIPSANISIPKDWPLDMRGAITCVTCHTRLPSLDGTGNVPLRGIGESSVQNHAFCAKCHNSTGHQGGRSLHWLATGIAHTRKEEARASQSGGRLDMESRRCLSCHDGINAVDDAGGSGKTGHGGMMVRGGEHPVGVEYSSKLSRNMNTRLRPANLLPDKVRLPGGRVSCVSCHDLFAANSHHLTVPNEGSALCFTCHNMD